MEFIVCTRGNATLPSKLTPAGRKYHVAFFDRSRFVIKGTHEFCTSEINFCDISNSFVSIARSSLFKKRTNLGSLAKLQINKNPTNSDVCEIIIHVS